MLALIIFLLTLLGILTRPFKLKIWVFSSVGVAMLGLVLWVLGSKFVLVKQSVI